MFLLYNSENLLLNQHLSLFLMLFSRFCPENITCSIISEGMDYMVMLILLNLIGRNSLLIDNPGDNICSLLSSNLISAALAVQEVLKSLSGTSAKCCNSCSSIWSRWWLNSYHFRKKRGIVGKRCDYCLKLAAWWCC